MNAEQLLLRVPRGAASRVRLLFYRMLGMKMGRRNRMEGKGRCRRLTQIRIGEFNSFTQGCWLWPVDVPFGGIRIAIGNYNYFNRNLMIDACGYVEIGGAWDRELFYTKVPPIGDFELRNAFFLAAGIAY